MANRIGWLDSTREPAHIHLTDDGGETTRCGHPVGEHNRSGRWRVTNAVPRKIRGRSNYCRVCFRNGGKTEPFVGGSEN